MLFSSTLLALVLSTPEAEAKRYVPRAVLLDLEPGVLDAVRATVVTTDTATAMVALEVSSGSGTETVSLEEGNAYLHGVATIKALPTVDADLTVTVYDEGSASLLSFSGTLGADGTVSLSALTTLDLEVLAAEVFANADGGYDLALDLSGADTYDIAYADVRIDESTGVVTCTKTGGCTTTIVSTTAEVGFDAIGSVWEGALALSHEGEIEIGTTTYDADGKQLEKSTAYLGRMLHTVEDSFPAGHAMLSAGDAGSVAFFHKEIDKSTPILYRAAIVTDGWTIATAPTHAIVELDGGETLTIPANSFQVTASTPIKFSGDPEKEEFQLTIDGVVAKTGSSVTRRGICAYGRCFALAQGEAGDWTLSATAYTATTADLPKSVTVTLTSTLKAAQTSEKSYTLSFEDDVAVVFANELDLADDPLGVDLGGQVSLLGAADKNGKQNTIAKGNFYGSFVRTGGGELALGGADKNDIQAKGDILIGGEPIDFEKTDDNGDGVIEAPPVILMKNGTGTRNTSANSSQTQQSQLL